MEKTMLWEAFQTLDKTSLREFDKFVRSPFYNQKQPLVALFEYLRKCMAQAVQPTPAQAFQAVFAGEVFDDTRLRLANSDLLELLEQYWAVKGLSSDAVSGKIHLAEYYRRNNLAKHFQITLRETRKQLSGRPYRNAAYFQRLHDLEIEGFQAASVAKRHEAFNLQEISDLLDTGYIARKLRHVCLSLSHQAVYKTAYRFGMLEEVFHYVERENLLETPAISLYYHACRFLADPAAQEHFFRFRQILTTSAVQFEEEELRTLYLLAINYGVKKSNETGMPWFRETFELYREALDRNLLLENGLLSRFAYQNIVIIALRLDELDWAEQFIHQYKQYLERQYREASFSLNLARVAYRRRDYRTALLELQRADYKDLINNLNAKILQLKIYYETGEIDSLESHLDSMKTYIRRQDAIGYHRENYLNIIRFTRALLRLNPHDAQEVRQLQAQIEQESTLTEREWLLEQLR